MLLLSLFFRTCWAITFGEVHVCRILSATSVSAADQCLLPCRINRHKYLSFLALKKNSRREALSSSPLLLLPFDVSCCRPRLLIAHRSQRSFYLLFHGRCHQQESSTMEQLIFKAIKKNMAARRRRRGDPSMVKCVCEHPDVYRADLLLLLEKKEKKAGRILFKNGKTRKGCSRSPHMCASRMRQVLGL